MTARTSASDRPHTLGARGASRMAGIPVSRWVRKAVPITGFSSDHETLGSLPTVTTLSATSTWAIEDQVVQLSPLHTGDEHVQVLAHHRATQDGRIVVASEHPHRHGLQTVSFGGNDPAVLGHLWRLADREPQHAGDARPQHVGIDESDRVVSLVERDRQMDGNGRLAHAALPLPTATRCRIPGSFS